MKSQLACTVILGLSCLLYSTHALSQCTVCQDGSPIQFSKAIIGETGQTCSELEEEAKQYEDPIACRYYHRYGNTCGCRNTPPPETFCGLCQKQNDHITDKSMWLDGFDATCETLEVDAAWNLWGTFSADDVDMTIEQDNCDYYHHLGSLCGCKRNKPPENGCNLCSDGRPPLLLDKAVTPNNAAEETCEALSLFTQYHQVEGSPECQSTQAVAGPYCGCAETMVDTATCDFCPQGLVLREGWAPDVEFAAGNRIFYFHDATCIKVAMLASAYGFPCGTAPRDFTDACCQPATELLGPEVFIQAQPENEKLEPTLILEENEAAKEDPYEINWDEFVFFTSATRSSFSGLSSVGTLTIVMFVAYTAR